MTSLEKLKVLLYGETKDEFGRINFSQRLKIAKELEKEFKALEIIRNVGAIAFILDKWLIQQVITKEEYDLLKEVLL